MPSELAPLAARSLFGDPIPRAAKEVGDFAGALEDNQLDSQVRRGDTKAAWEDIKPDFFD
jgi:hypothetical protein